MSAEPHLLANVLRRLILEPEGGGGAGLSNGDWFHIDSAAPVSIAEYRALQALFEECE